MIHVKTPQEIELMRESGKISALALKNVISAVKTGVTLKELDKIAEKTILNAGAKPSFKMVEGYQYTTCLNINAGVVHGIPGSYILKKGDLLSIDLGAFYKGFHSDLSWTLEVESNEEQKFVETGKEALEVAIFNCVVGNHVGDISNAIQTVVERAGYTVSRDLVGHGVGRDLHEDPYVPGYGKKGSGPLLKEGMVLAIEIIYQKGSPKLVLEDDNWTLSTADNSLSGLFEHSVAVTKNGPVVLTEA
jgi:methionyl aminopeptidase